METDMLNFGLMLLALAALTAMQRDARAMQAVFALANGLSCIVAGQSCDGDRRD
jgi:hypothetical protein